MSKTYIQICRDLAQESLLLSSTERSAISKLVESASKWDKHVKETTVSSEDLKKVLGHYFDVKMIPSHQRKGLYRTYLRGAKDLLNKCGKDASVATHVIDRVNEKFAELPNWTLYACVKHCGSIINE